MNMYTCDEWIEKVADYYNAHNVGDILFITFDDFCEVVKSGRWNEYASVHGLPERREFKTEIAEVFIRKSGNNAGYCAKVFGKNKNTYTYCYGTGFDARRMALTHVKELQLA